MLAITAFASLYAENDLSGSDRTKIRALLTAAFPDYAALWIEHDSWAGPLDFRLLLRDHSGRLIGHLGIGRRLIEVGEDRLLVAGIGTVAILPELQGQGLGRRLLGDLHGLLCREMQVDFGFLQCRDAVVGFYEKAGFHRIRQHVRSFDPTLRRWQLDDAAALVLPAVASIAAWPSDGLVDLMGMPW